MFHEFSKREKKITKTCIDKGLEAEFKEGLENFHAIMQDGQTGKFASNGFIGGLEDPVARNLHDARTSFLLSALTSPYKCSPREQVMYRPQFTFFLDNV